MTDHEKKMETLGKAFYECRMTQEAALEYAQLAEYADELEAECTRLRGCPRDACASLPIMLAGYVTRDMMSDELDKLHDYLCNCDVRGVEGADKTAVDDAIGLMKGLSEMSVVFGKTCVSLEEKVAEVEGMRAALRKASISYYFVPHEGSDDHRHGAIVWTGKCSACGGSWDGIQSGPVLDAPEDGESHHDGCMAQPGEVEK